MTSIDLQPNLKNNMATYISPIIDWDYKFRMGFNRGERTKLHSIV